MRWFIEQAGPRFQQHYQQTKNENTPTRDESGSGYGFRFIADCKRKGMSYDATRDAILIDEGEAGGWARRKDERDIKRAWNHAAVAAPVKQYEMVRASDVVIKPLDWLWEGHLLRGAQEITAGLKALGKSQIQCSLVASATTGKDWPDGSPGPEPGNVIMVTAEDSRDQVVVPRLMSAAADLSRVFFLYAIKQDAKRRMFLLGEDLDQLERMIADIGNVNLVTIDPITAFMGKINSHNTTDVRGQLGPLADLAERTNVAASTITHPPKQGSQKAIDQFVGSQALITAARIGHLCVPEMQPDGVTPTGRSLFTIAATNHRKMSSLAYRIETTEVRPKAPKGDREAQLRARASTVEDVPFIAWEGKVGISADEALAAARGKTKASSAAEVDELLRDLLAAGPMSADDIYDKGTKKGFSKDQLWRASKRLGVTRHGHKGCGSHWEWELD